MRISNCFVIACNIQIVIRMLYHSFETLLLLSFFYLMVKSGKSFVKIGSRFQIALLFLSYRNFRPPPPPDPPFIMTPIEPLPLLPTRTLLHLFGTQVYTDLRVDIFSGLSVVSAVNLKRH